MQAAVSGIHANLEAFQAVLVDMKAFAVTEVICLGDTIGYGPNPKECLDLSLDFDVAILGNHEQALLVEKEERLFRARAKASIAWTRQQLSMLGHHRESNPRRWDYLGSLDHKHVDEDILYVHGTPRDPIVEYLYPKDIYWPEKMGEIFGLIDWLCFLGHTHVPGIWTETLTFLSPEDVDYRYRIGNEKTIINVGSVGQARDRDPRASYVILDDDVVIFRKLNYDLEKTAAKLEGIPTLNPDLTERLRQGR